MDIFILQCSINLSLLCRHKDEHSIVFLTYVFDSTMRVNKYTNQPKKEELKAFCRIQNSKPYCHAMILHLIYLVSPLLFSVFHRYLSNERCATMALYEDSSICDDYRKRAHNSSHSQKRSLKKTCESIPVC